MKTIRQLIWLYFTGTKLHRGLSLGGLALMGLAFLILIKQAQATGSVWLVAVLGMSCFFLGSSLMPLMLGRLASGHSIRVLPHGRLKLLLSAFITVLIVSTPGALMAPLVFVVGASGSLSDLVKHPKALEYGLQMAAIVFTSSILFAGWMYLAMWFVTSQRNTAGLFKGLLVIVLLLFAPVREIRDFTVHAAWNWQQIAVIWVVFGMGFLLWPRIRASVARGSTPRLTGLRRGLARNLKGREFDLMLGTANPWRLMAALLLPVMISTRFAEDMSAVWLYILTIFSTVAGAIAGGAAARGRSLWLRGDWSREKLFAEVELSFWRHNAFVLGALMLILVAIGSYSGFSVTLLAAGLPLLALATVLSTYLGLMITRGLGWIESLLGVGVMLTLMTVAIMVARETVDIVGVIVIQVSLAVLAVVLRMVARHRWMQIDWMMCRADRASIARGG